LSRDNGLAGVLGVFGGKSPASRYALLFQFIVAVECSSRKTHKQRGLDYLFEMMVEGDTVVVTEISRLARSISELIEIINNCLVKRGIGLVAIKQGIKIPAGIGKLDAGTKTIVTVFALMAALERDLISDRTKMALSVKREQGVRLGRPSYTGVSRLDDRIDEVRRWLADRWSVKRIAEETGMSWCAVNSYIKSRGL